MKVIWVSVLFLVGCSAQGQDECANGVCACNPEARHVGGTALSFTSVELGNNGSCPHRLLASAADVASAFPNGDAPPEVMAADFASERVVLGSSNPALRFAVDSGVDLTVGEESVCQGAAPSCTAYIVHGTTRNTLSAVACPYTGPDPCLAP